MVCTRNGAVRPFRLSTAARGLALAPWTFPRILRKCTADAHAAKSAGLARGVPFATCGADMREGQGSLNRVAFLEQSGQEWMPSIPDVHARLLADPSARVAELGCGVGWASIGLARAYAKITVDGFDLDVPCMSLARTNAQAMGVAVRVSVTVRDAAAVATESPTIRCLRSSASTTCPIPLKRSARCALWPDRTASLSWTCASASRSQRVTKRQNDSCTASAACAGCQPAWPRRLQPGCAP